jgi:hypothetical protein
MVSKASDDLPEPLSPVITVRLLRGNLDVDILQIVLARAMHGDPVEHIQFWDRRRLQAEVLADEAAAREAETETATPHTDRPDAVGHASACPGAMARRACTSAARVDKLKHVPRRPYCKSISGVRRLE